MQPATPAITSEAAVQQPPAVCTVLPAERKALLLS